MDPTNANVQGLAALSLVIFGIYTAWLRERAPTRRNQFTAMTVSDYFVAIGHISGCSFVLICSLTSIYGLQNIRGCTISGACCIAAVTISKATAILLMYEKLRQTSQKAQAIPRRKDLECIIHYGLFLSALVSLAAWLLHTFRPGIVANVCMFRWHVSAFLAVLLLAISSQVYLTIRCSWTLIRTKHEIMRTWAYRLIMGCTICVAATLSNLGYLAALKAQMQSSGCLRSCLLDVFLTSLATHYLLHPQPMYKTLNDLPQDIPLDLVEGEVIRDVAAPSIFSFARAAPSYKTKLTGDNKSFRFKTASIKTRNSHATVTLGSGATSDGIAAYLSQVSNVAADVVTSPTQKPRHISLLPSHPSFSVYERPRPIYSCYPNYSLEEVNNEDEEASIGNESLRSPSKAIASIEVADLVSTPSTESSIALRQNLYACDSIHEVSDEDEEEGDNDDEDDEKSTGSLSDYTHNQGPAQQPRTRRTSVVRFQ